ncbi:hypothetical protein SAMN05216275_10512 [Streptosporangium canum]|uniref:Uncharacterized protein n=1 Tax=Streptosporangium canum TaxID=324952 RepID=A0A1I3L4P4_9ACTN|nr:hypothetical protein [Streptosporangium canum]SFI79672.1 hypothetical protein SAMN05216275_10512 [Streptosporangium canum]
MTSEELAQEIMSAVVAVQARILGVGKAQYDEGSQQKFELMSLQELVQYAMEEVEDGIAYNVMLRYKLTLLKEAVDQAFTGYATNTAKHAKPAAPPVPPSEPAPVSVHAPNYTSWPSAFDAPLRTPADPGYGRGLR